MVKLGVTLLCTDLDELLPALHVLARKPCATLRPGALTLVQEVPSHTSSQHSPAWCFGRLTRLSTGRRTTQRPTGRRGG